MKNAKEGDTVRTRLFITPILVYFVSLLITSLAVIPPLSEVIRALALGVIGCAGLGYTFNLALLLRRPGAPEEIEALWDIVLPIASYSLLVGGGLGPQGPVRRFERGGRSRGHSSSPCAKAGR